MRIRTIGLIVIVASIGLILTLSMGYYKLQRSFILDFIGNGLNESIFAIEQEIQEKLHREAKEEIQSILDQGSAINKGIDTLSVSLDGKTIAYSSSRALNQEPVLKGYFPLSELKKKMIEDGETRFETQFDYFEGYHKKKVFLYIELDRNYIFESMGRMALMYGIALFISLLLLVVVVSEGIRRLAVNPLQKMTQKAGEALNDEDEFYLYELASLDHALSESFASLKEREAKLQESLEESRYLESILQTIANVNKLLITAANVNELMERCTQEIASHPGYGLCWIGMLEKDQIRITAISDPSIEYYQKGLRFSIANEHESAPCSRAIAENKMILIDCLEESDSIFPWYFLAQEKEFDMIVALPLRAHVNDLPIGVMVLYAKGPKALQPKEVEMLEELSGDIGFAIDSFVRREELLFHQTTDSLTNLPNRTSMIERMRGYYSGVAVINIDRFSEINEVYGIEIGDGILSGYGFWLKQWLASNGGATLYKMGSDEYAIVFDRESSESTNLLILQELIESTAQQAFFIEAVEVVLTVTVGYAPYSERAMEEATQALKEAKDAHNTLQIFTPELSRKKHQEENIAWYKEIKLALEEDRIVPYFQPIVENQSGKIIKYEALIRLIKQDGTVVSPFFFLNIAKKTRLYIELTKIMVFKVAEVFRNQTIPVSINLSTEDIANSHLADYLEKTILDNGIGQLIIFEILESEGISNYAEVSAFIDRFKAIGCRLAIDDFGAGYSNFDHLLKLNIDTLKIDGSLIKNLSHDQNARIIVKHIQDFAQEMGIDTVAEFVSNEIIFEQVRSLGITASQGYYFYEPSANLVLDHA